MMLQMLLPQKSSTFQAAPAWLCNNGAPMMEERAVTQLRQRAILHIQSRIQLGSACWYCGNTMEMQFPARLC